MAASLAAAEATNTPTATVVEADNSAQVAAASTEGEAVAGVAQVASLEAEQTPLPTPLPTASPTPTAVVTPLPTPTSTPVVYQVRAGDTLVTIAAEYEVDVEELMAANQISAQQVFAIQPGQMLIIPVATPEPGAEVASAAAALRLSAPTLLIPSADATVGCATGGKLIWERVQFVKDSDRYILHLGFVAGVNSEGQEEVTWVLAQSSPVTQTEWELDTALCDLAPASSNQQWRWWVEVVEDQGGSALAVSPPSEIRGFTWR
jgi:LysM repeat protein